MTVRHLDKLFRPASIAVVGAVGDDGALGAVVMRNLLEGGFPGPILPVSPDREAVHGVLAYPDVGALPLVPDLAIVCAPPDAVPGLVGALGARGVRATAVLGAASGARAGTERDALLAAAGAHRMRVLGPNCLGAIVPGAHLNASFAHCAPAPGRIAFVSQSGALCTVVLDWASARGIGFSHFVSLGEALDVDFGDIIDWLGSDAATRAILLYVESIAGGRKFMSAARAAARNKPVLVIKAGRGPEGARAAHTHTGALAGSDDVYDAAIRRAGMLRVYAIEELFAAVETLARAGTLRGERLAVVSNGGGLAVMAADSLADAGGRLAALAPPTVAALDARLPAAWSRENPVDIIGDAPPERYADAVRVLAAAPEVDALLVMHAPSAVVASVDAARAVVDAVAGGVAANVLTSWVGERAVEPARRVFAEAGLASYETPGLAVRAFMHLVEYRRNRDMLMETPTSAPAEFTPATAAARLVVERALASGSEFLSEPEAKAVLAAYGIPTVETHIVRTSDEAATMAEEIGFPVALKILSPDVTHKSDVGGVDLFLDSADAVRRAADAMRASVERHFPRARLSGFTVQRMAIRPGANELVLGVSTDAVFGPAILFGHGGTAVEVIADRAVALPPLNPSLARELVSRTRVARLLGGYRNRPPVDMDALALALVQVSQMIVDIPEIDALDVNPLLADEHGVLALDARMRVVPAGGARRLAIRPYPKELEERLRLADGRDALLRPIRPEDEPAHRAFLAALTPEDIRFRFFGLVRDLPHSQMARLTQIDYDREMAFVATAAAAGGGRETLGVVRTVTDPDNERAEFAIVVRSDLKRHGLGRALLEKMIRYSRSRGTRRLVGQVLAENERMLRFCERLGFTRRRVPGAGVVEVDLAL